VGKTEVGAGVWAATLRRIRKHTVFSGPGDSLCHDMSLLNWVIVEGESAVVDALPHSRFSGLWSSRSIAAGTG
jgi:hypothetical protein